MTEFPSVPDQLDLLAGLGQQSDPTRSAHGDCSSAVEGPQVNASIELRAASQMGSDGQPERLLIVDTETSGLDAETKKAAMIYVSAFTSIATAAAS